MLIVGDEAHGHALLSVCALDDSWEVIIGRLIPTTSYRARRSGARIKEALHSIIVFVVVLASLVAEAALRRKLWTVDA